MRREAPRRRLFAARASQNDDGGSWRAGAAGEEAVARRLGMLRAVDYRWGYLNSVPVGSREADIDHVVMGPGGVFTINTKHHRGASLWVTGGTFLVNGAKQPYIRASRFEGERAARLLSRACGFQVPVTPLIVPVGCRKLTIREDPDGVSVVTPEKLPIWLGKHPDVIPPQQLRIILERARISTTWTR
ncbi:nuclease-related domain-containing protein [Georgenia daeguensis]|uniref:nuclease-related domain-containing protein n=1 Tax=Georgenia daeguensis TaxID=908355 RepID=UPI0031EC88B0